MKHEAKTQAPVVAERNPGCLTDALRQGIDLAAENYGYVFAWVGPATDSDGVVGMGFGGGFIVR